MASESKSSHIHGELAPLMSEYVRRPDPVYALKVTSRNIAPFVKAGVAGFWVPGSETVHWSCKTAHGDVNAAWGDYIVTDGRGDWWPVKADIFEARYRATRVVPADG